jgi:hypothetical protein
MKTDNSHNRFEGAQVLITRGDYRGCEGACLGRINEVHWAISPDGSDDIVNLEFEKDFSLLIDLSSDPVRN